MIDRKSVAVGFLIGVISVLAPSLGVAQRSYPADADRVLAVDTAGGWVNVDFLIEEDGLAEAKQCVRSRTTAEAVACYAFDTQTAYHASDPQTAGNFKAGPCWSAYWTRDKTGSKSGQGDPIGLSSCPDGQDTSADSSGALEDDPVTARDQDAPWNMPGGAVSDEENRTLQVAGSRVRLTSKAGTRLLFGWQVTIENMSGERKCVIGGITLVDGDGRELAAASKWQWIGAESRRDFRGAEGVAETYAGPAVRYKAEATSALQAQERMCNLNN